jgi:hypothetical protein
MRNLTWATALVVAIANGATAQEPAALERKREVIEASGRIGGEVLSISDSGEVLTVEKKIILWGLLPTKKEKIEELLVGRQILCDLLLDQGSNVLANCVLRPSKSTLPMSNTMDLFTWLVEFGYADPSCRPNQPESIALIHSGSWIYSCTPDGRPERLPYIVNESTTGENGE